MPVQYRWVQSLNPMTYILEAHRAVLIEGDLPELGFYVVAVLAVGLITVGTVVYNHLSGTFVDELCSVPALVAGCNVAKRYRRPPSGGSRTPAQPERAHSLCREHPGPCATCPSRSPPARRSASSASTVVGSRRCCGSPRGLTGARRGR